MINQKKLINWCSSLKQVAFNDTWYVDFLPQGYVFSFIHQGNRFSRAAVWVSPDKFKYLVKFHKDSTETVRCRYP